MSSRAGLALLGAVLLFHAGCGRQERKGELMVSVTSQMPVPKDIQYVSIEVRFQGRRQFYRSFKVEQDQPAGLQLPASLAVIEGSKRTEPVGIRIGAWDRNKVLRVVREVTTTVPAQRIALLPVELEWFCYGQVDEVKFDDVEMQDDVSVSSSCTQGETCVAGSCVSDVIDSSTLPDFLQKELEPGNDAGACFDVGTCFATAPRVFVLNDATCEIDRLEGGTGVNVALELPPGSPGFCTSARCLVPLSGYSEQGWTQVGSRLRLHPSACQLIQQGTVRGVVASIACPTKTISVASCPQVAPAPSGPGGNPGVDAGGNAPVDAGSEAGAPAAVPAGADGGS